MINHDVRVVLFVRMAEGYALNEDIQAHIRASLKKEASPRHVPAVILEVRDIPRTVPAKSPNWQCAILFRGGRLKIPKP